jgi:hypothetical protein
MTCYVSVAVASSTAALECSPDRPGHGVWFGLEFLLERVVGLQIRRPIGLASYRRAWSIDLIYQAPAARADMMHRRVSVVNLNKSSDE